MKEIKNTIFIKGLMRWLIEATLVFGLIVFSEHISLFKSYSREHVKTEVKQETNLTNSKNTACFKKNHDVNSYSSLESPSYHETSFISCLIYFESNIKVKLSVRKIAEQNQEKNFLRHYNFHNSTQSDSDNLRG